MTREEYLEKIELSYFHKVEEQDLYYKMVEKVSQSNFDSETIRACAYNTLLREQPEKVKKWRDLELELLLEKTKRETRYWPEN